MFYSNIQINDDDIFVLFKITHYYYTFAGAMITMVAGVVISYFTQNVTDPKVNPDAISPVVYWIRQKWGRRIVDDQMQEMKVQEAQTLISQVNKTES